MTPTDISMHLPHPLASAFEYVARAGLKTPDGTDDCTKALSWLDIEEKRRSMVMTQSHDAVVRAAPMLERWVQGDGVGELLRAIAITAIVDTACNWMHPELLGRARDAVTALRDWMVANG